MKYEAFFGSNYGVIEFYYQLELYAKNQSSLTLSEIREIRRNAIGSLKFDGLTNKEARGVIRAIEVKFGLIV